MWSAAMDVGGWLRNLGLGQYEQTFRDNRIDADVLPHMTADDLKDIGVAAVGDRRRHVSAVAALTGARSPADIRASEQIFSPPKKAVEISAERRPITVMFCDLVGSTSLAAKLDAEDWRNLVNAYLDEASAAVTGLGGHVLKKLGDGLMSHFGYPRAQENDAERAVRAALAIQRALAELNAQHASGAPELVARIGERQVAGLFIAEDKGAHELKSLPAPIPLYRILRVSGGRRPSSHALLSAVRRKWSFSPGAESAPAPAKGSSYRSLASLPGVVDVADG
jgi:hypothetical protein